MLDLSSHQTSSCEKKKTKKKIFKKSRGYLVSCTVAIFSSKTKLYKLWARFIRKRNLLLTRDFLNILFWSQFETTLQIE